MNATASAATTEATEVPDGVRTVPVDGEHSVAYATYGDPAGAPLVLFHGTPGSHRLGALFDEAASRAGVYVIAPDRPGYGESDGWPDRTLRDTGAIVAALLDDIGASKTRVAGFSGGGPHALAAAATLPERVTSVEVLSGSTPPSLSQATPPLQRLLGGLGSWTPRMLGGLFALQRRVASDRPPAFVLDQYTDDPGAVSDPAAAVIKDDFLTGLAQGGTGAAREFGLVRGQWAGIAAAVDLPVRVWHGSDDDNVALADAKRLADHIGATMTTLEGEDHLTALLAAFPRVVEAQANGTAANR
jgi:pimeloyl-ACP methyl ester carboxylesterase